MEPRCIIHGQEPTEVHREERVREGDEEVGIGGRETLRKESSILRVTNLSRRNNADRTFANLFQGIIRLNGKLIALIPRKTDDILGISSRVVKFGILKSSHLLLFTLLNNSPAEIFIVCYIRFDLSQSPLPLTLLLLLLLLLLSLGGSKWLDRRFKNGRL